MRIIAWAVAWAYHSLSQGCSPCNHVDAPEPAALWCGWQSPPLLSNSLPHLHTALTALCLFLSSSFALLMADCAATAVFSMSFSHSVWISAEDSDVLFSLFAVVVG